MYRYVIAKTARGQEVYVNLITSPAGKYLSRQPYLIGHIKEVLAPLKFSAPQMSIERDMGRVIGNTDIIDTTDKDSIFYAQPIKKSVFSRYAKNRSPLPSHKLTIILKRDDGGDYEVADTWIGPCSPPFPGDEHETDTSKQYWETHALVQDAQLVQSKTITKVCPY
jgi:hypothetical protein